MSLSMDVLQEAIAMIENREVYVAARILVDALHDYSHTHNDNLNRGRIRLAAGKLDQALQKAKAKNE